MRILTVLLVFVLGGIVFAAVQAPPPSDPHTICSGGSPNEFCDNVGKAMFGFTGGNLMNLGVGIARSSTPKTKVFDYYKSGSVDFFDTGKGL